MSQKRSRNWTSLQTMRLWISVFVAQAAACSASPPVSVATTPPKLHQESGSCHVCGLVELGSLVRRNPRYPFNEFMSTPALGRFVNGGSPDPRYSASWTRTSEPPVEWITTPPDPAHRCEDAELICRFAARYGTWDDAYPSIGTFCDDYCTAQYHRCKSDEYWDSATALTSSCAGSAGCSVSVNTGVRALTRSAEHAYWAAALLMHGEDGEGVSCQGYEEDVPGQIDPARPSIEFHEHAIGPVPGQDRLLHRASRGGLR